MANTRPTRKPVAPVEEVSDACREQLLTGHDFFGDGYGHDAENDPTAMERMRQSTEEMMRDPMATHVRNLIESYSRMSPEERATHGLPEKGWEDEVRRRFGKT